jgi:hypothetical protein
MATPPINPATPLPPPGPGDKDGNNLGADATGQPYGTPNTLVKPNDGVSQAQSHSETVAAKPPYN